jgi:hypothetical protein
MTEADWLTKPGVPRPLFRAPLGAFHERGFFDRFGGVGECLGRVLGDTRSVCRQSRHRVELRAHARRFPGGLESNVGAVVTVGDVRRPEFAARVESAACKEIPRPLHIASGSTNRVVREFRDGTESFQCFRSALGPEAVNHAITATVTTQVIASRRRTRMMASVESRGVLSSLLK